MTASHATALATSSVKVLQCVMTLVGRRARRSQRAAASCSRPGQAVSSSRCSLEAFVFYRFESRTRRYSRPRLQSAVQGNSLNLDSARSAKLQRNRWRRSSRSRRTLFLRQTGDHLVDRTQQRCTIPVLRIHPDSADAPNCSSPDQACPFWPWSPLRPLAGSSPPASASSSPRMRSAPESSSGSCSPNLCPPVFAPLGMGIALLLNQGASTLIAGRLPASRGQIRVLRDVRFLSDYARYSTSRYRSVPPSRDERARRSKKSSSTSRGRAHA